MEKNELQVKVTTLEKQVEALTKKLKEQDKCPKCGYKDKDWDYRYYLIILILMKTFDKFYKNFYFKYLI